MNSRSEEVNPTLPQPMWREPIPQSFLIRSKSYLDNKHKEPSNQATFHLHAIDLFEVPEPMQNIAGHPKNRIYQEAIKNPSSSTWYFVVNIMIPEVKGKLLSFVIYFSGNKSFLEEDSPFNRIARPFFLGDDDIFRNHHFKLIPRIIEGNYVLKSAVKNKPVLLGNKLHQYYHKGENYFEIDVDISSSKAAKYTVGLAMGYTKSIVVDMGFCLQGDAEDELPEVLLGCCTFSYADLDCASNW